ncbi:MAG: hypothetical protein J6A25_07940 [Lachnospiraceae bacterium]|nr:hypothetical protein [Lachnospiraceae bacterium]
MINYNRNIFNKIDNEEKAYWLGFIVADGYLNINKHMLRIKLGNRDRSHLIKFIKFVGGNEEMLKSEIHSETGNENFYVSLYSKEVMNDLLSLGIEQAKSGKEKVCNIDKKYYRDFIRGLWDGDGFIRENLSGIGLVGSEEVLAFVQNYFNDSLGVKPLKIYPHCNTFKIEYRSTRKAIPLILNHLYGDKDVALDRKKELATKIEKIC